DCAAGPAGTGGSGARGDGDDCESAVEGERERIHAAINKRVDVWRCGEFAGAAAGSSGAIGAGGSDFGADRERQPANDWTRPGRCSVRAGEGAGGDEPEGATGERAGAQGSGGGGTGGFEFGDRPNESGNSSAEYGDIDAGAGG